MTGARIVTLADGSRRRALWPEIAAIFFLSSPTQRFASPDERDAFLERWTGWYRDEAPELVLAALASDGTVAGYLTGCHDSGAAKRLYGDIESYALFDDLFGDYPAHFHVNCHPDWRCKGIGRRLAEAFITGCAGQGIAGVHVVTAEGAHNAEFYRRRGLEAVAARPWQGRDLVLMGRRLRVEVDGAS